MLLMIRLRFRFAFCNISIYASSLHIANVAISQNHHTYRSEKLYTAINGYYHSLYKIQKKMHNEEVINKMV